MAELQALCVRVQMGYLRVRFADHLNCSDNDNGKDGSLIKWVDAPSVESDKHDVTSPVTARYNQNAISLFRPHFELSKAQNRRKSNL